MKKYLLILFGLLFATPLIAKTRDIYFEYYTQDIKWRPIIISQTHPAQTFIFGAQNHAYSFSDYLTLDMGIDITHNNLGGETLWTAAAYPALRAWLYQDSDIRPFLEYSVGPAWISQCNLGNTALGAHFSFQNELGIGINAGKMHIFNFMLKYYHYTNFGMSKPNHGFDIPLVFSVGYEF